MSVVNDKCRIGSELLTVAPCDEIHKAAIHIRAPSASETQHTEKLEVCARYRACKSGFTRNSCKVCVGSLALSCAVSRAKCSRLDTQAIDKSEARVRHHKHCFKCFRDTTKGVPLLISLHGHGRF